MENASKEMHSNKNSLSSEESDELTFGLPSHSLEDVQAKRNTHKLLRSNHPYYRNVAKHLWREPQIIKLENYFQIISTYATSVNNTFCNVACQEHFHARLTDCNLQSQLHCAVTHFEQNFTKLVPDSCFIIGE